MRYLSEANGCSTVDRRNRIISGILNNTNENRAKGIDNFIYGWGASICGHYGAGGCITASPGFGAAGEFGFGFGAGAGGGFTNTWREIKNFFHSIGPPASYGCAETGMGC
jgi:hypothetical protein